MPLVAVPRFFPQSLGDRSPLPGRAAGATDQRGGLQEATRTELASLRERVSILETQLQATLAREMEAARELATNQGRFASMTEMLRDSGQEMLLLRQELAASQRDVARAVGWFLYPSYAADEKKGGNIAGVRVLKKHTWERTTEV